MNGIHSHTVRPEERAGRVSRRVNLSQGFAMLVVVLATLALCVIASGVWYSLCLHADIVYERERYVKQCIVAEQVMKQAIDFVKTRGESLFSAKSRRKLPLQFQLYGDDDAKEKATFVVTVSESKSHEKLPTLLISLHMMKRGMSVMGIACMISQEYEVVGMIKRMRYVVHHYTLGTVL